MHDDPTLSATAGPEGDTPPTRIDRTSRDGGRLVDLARGAAVGRYVILERVGSGGMGTVYAAFDPELDRKVAIKLLHLQDGEGSRAERRRTRLMREAQAMARLSHPNVVSVHDVGRVGDDIFVAMEFIDGETLGAWLRRERRSWASVIDCFLEAGHGLMAAHGKGLVHRDFKPDNVLVGSDGRVLVTDFGLARAAEAEGEREGEARGEDEPAASNEDSIPQQPVSEDLLGSPLTLTGSTVGTPAYMSPEQFLCRPTDARSDQFSFCVALYEGLFRQRPFEGDNAAALGVAVMSGQIRSPPGGFGVPGRVLEVVRRGLAPDPKLRHESMQALLARLTRAARSRRPMVLAAGGVLVAGAGAALAVSLLNPDPQAALCTDGTQRLEGAWDEERAAQVNRAFEDLGRPFARTVAQTVIAKLDDRAAAWATQYEENCQATQVRHEQSEEMFDLRMACLAGHRAEIDALVDALVTVDETGARHAVRAVERLGDLSTCSDAEELRRPVPLPTDPAARQAIEETREGLAAVRAAVNLGHYRQGEKLAIGVVARAEEIGFRPLLADARFELGVTQWLGEDPKAGAQTLVASHHDAVASGHDARAAQAASELVHLYGGILGDTDQALRWAGHAGALLHRLGRDPEQDARLTNALGIVAEHQAEFAEALRLYRISAKLREAEFGHMDIGVANALNNVALVLENQSKWDEAVELHQEAMEIRLALGGPSHPEVGDSHNNIGLVLQGQGNYEKAREHYEAALRIYEDALGPEAVTAASAHNNLGAVLDQLGREEEALEHFLLALKIREKALGPDHSLVASALKNLGNTYSSMGRGDEAREVLERALKIQIKTLGPEHPYGAETRMYLGDLDRDAGRYDEAQAYYIEARRILDAAFPDGHAMAAQVVLYLGRTQRDRGDKAGALKTFQEALALAEATAGPDHGLTGNILTDLGEAWLRAGSHAKARAALERSLEIRQTNHTPPEALAHTQTLLAQTHQGF